jgi:bone morphogenetic protein receptor type-2
MISSIAFALSLFFLCRFFGCGDRIGIDGTTEYLIVLSYVERGSLADFLQENTLEWASLCRMIHSAAAGLAHLHADFTKGGEESCSVLVFILQLNFQNSSDQSKPAIAHRDVNSRNVLVKADLTCCLVDFGFAMRIDGCHIYRNGQEENAEQTSLSDVCLRFLLLQFDL